MKKSISIFGSTGSIGVQTVDLIKENLNKYNVEVLTAQNNFHLLAEQAKELGAQKVVITNQSHYKDLKPLLNIEVLSGEDALVECAQIPVDITVMAITGIAALPPTIAALQNTEKLALANKEVLVCAGNIINSMQKQAKIIPIDSEHNAIFQIYNKEVDNITLTASGGPFYKNNTKTSLREALKHPIWKMGEKISVDSATMMNKVLEVIEAHYLFDISLDKINILIHPEAIIHGMVSYSDGNNIAVLTTPNMKIPISYALNWPERNTNSALKLNLSEVHSLTFYKADPKEFPALKFLDSVNYIALNIANEIAVDLFLKEKIEFNNIIPLVAEIVETSGSFQAKTITDVIEQHEKIKTVSKTIIDNKITI